MSGTSSVVQLDAWNWEDAAIKVDDAIHVNWPGSFTRGRWWLGEDPALKPNPKYASSLDAIRDYFKEVKSYFAGTPLEKNIAYEATRGLFDGSKKMFIHASGHKEIKDAITICKENGINNIVIVRGEGALSVADLLVKHNIPVVLDRPHRNPNIEDDAYDHTYSLRAFAIPLAWVS